MPELQPLSPDLLLHIAQTLQLPLKGLVATIELLDEGGTVPFIARYRKEATGNLDEVQIRNIEEKLAYFRELVSRKETILASIAEQGKLTDDLKSRIEKTLEKSELEDLYLPYKPKRRTKAMIAREKGLEPLATYLWNQEPAATPLQTFAATFIDPALGIATTEEALEGARHIVAETISESADIRQLLRRTMFDEGVIVSKKITDAPDDEQKFTMYYDYREPVKQIPSHRMLAIRRGETSGVLYFVIELEPQRALDLIRAKVHKQTGDWTPHLNLSIEDSWKRLLNTSITSEVRLELKQRAGYRRHRRIPRQSSERPPRPARRPTRRPRTRPRHSHRLQNRRRRRYGKIPRPRRHLSLSAQKRHGRRRAHSQNAHRKTQRSSHRHRQRHGIPRDRRLRPRFTEKGKTETEIFAVTVQRIRRLHLLPPPTSPARNFDLDLTVRGAISIARRLQDPLAELVKLDPKSIGVGQYQHDVDQNHLHKSLETVIESCVNRVGVDLNTASWALLRYVAGITERTAQKIVEFRNENGRFRSRVQLNAVPGIGPKAFEQAAGFPPHPQRRPTARSKRRPSRVLPSGRTNCAGESSMSPSLNCL